MIRKNPIELSVDGEVVERCRRARRKLERRFQTPEAFFAWAAELDAKKTRERKRKRKMRPSGQNR